MSLNEVPSCEEEDEGDGEREVEVEEGEDIGGAIFRGFIFRRRPSSSFKSQLAQMVGFLLFFVFPLTRLS